MLVATNELNKGSYCLSWFQCAIIVPRWLGHLERYFIHQVCCLWGVDVTKGHLNWMHKVNKRTLKDFRNTWVFEIALIGHTGMRIIYITPPKIPLSPSYTKVVPFVSFTTQVIFASLVLYFHKLVTCYFGIEKFWMKCRWIRTGSGLYVKYE